MKNSFNSYTLDRVAQAGAEASVRDADYFRAVVARVVRTRDAAAARLKELGFRVYDSAANFLFISHDKAPARELLSGLRERGILVRWWDKPRIDNCLRVTIGTDGEMETFCRVIGELVGAYT